MQFSSALVTLFAATVAAQSVQEMVATIPKCALPCLQESSKKIGCGDMDNKCQCDNFADFTKGALICVGSSCSADDVKKAQQLGPEICAKVKASGGKSTSGSSSSSPSNSTMSASPSSSSGATSSSGSPDSASSSAVPGAGARAEIGMGLFGAAAVAAAAFAL